MFITACTEYYPLLMLTSHLILREPFSKRVTILLYPSLTCNTKTLVIYRDALEW